METNLGYGVKNAGMCLNPNCKNKSKNKFCSRKCYWICKKGTKLLEEHKQKISRALTGKKKSPEHIKNVCIALAPIRKLIAKRGEGHTNWKGEKIKYGSLHDWVASKLGKPKKCSKCGFDHPNARYQWSNISGKYKRELNDWERLCVGCHREKDKNKPSASLIYERQKSGSSPYGYKL